MSVIENNLTPLINSDVKKLKIIKKETSNTPKKINLCKKYFYIDNTKNMNLKQFNNGKILQLIENNNKQEKGGILEQVDNVITQFERKKTELNEKKIDCIKSMILNNKKIPEKWIMKPNYKDLLNQAMEDDIVLNYAIVCKDIYKKRAGMDQSDETRYLNYQKSLPPEKKFISYINPYSRNYLDSPDKKQLMNKYCLSINRYNNKRNKYINNYSLNNHENNTNLYKKINSKRSNSIGNISNDNNKLPLIKKRNKGDKDQNNTNEKGDINNKNMSETKDELMLTSLYYSGYQNNETKNDNNSAKKEFKLPELPLI